MKSDSQFSETVGGVEDSPRLPPEDTDIEMKEMGKKADPSDVYSEDRFNLAGGRRTRRHKKHSKTKRARKHRKGRKAKRHTRR